MMRQGLLLIMLAVSFFCTGFNFGMSAQKVITSTANAQVEAQVQRDSAPPSRAETERTITKAHEKIDRWTTLELADWMARNPGHSVFDMQLEGCRLESRYLISHPELVANVRPHERVRALSGGCQ